MKTQLDKISTALALLNSMVLCGENHSDQSTKIFYEASKAMGELYARQRDTEPKEGKELLDFILETDFLTTSEFCKKYNVPEPVFTGEVQSSARQFLQIDAIKHRMYVDKAKEIVRRKPVSEPVKEEGKGAEETDLIQYVTNLLYAAFDFKRIRSDKTLSKSYDFDKWVEEQTNNLTEFYASLPAKQNISDEEIEKWALRQAQTGGEALLYIWGAKAMRDGQIPKK